jgi:hypothetical protein
MGYRPQIDLDELSGLGGRRMRHADELYDRVASGERTAERRSIELIARDRLAPCWGLRDRRWPHESPHAMTAREEKWNQATAQVARSSRDEDRLMCHRLTLRPSSTPGLLAHDSHQTRQSEGPMAETFLEEQLKRIRKMTEQMSRVRMFHDAGEARHQSPDERTSALDETPERRTSTRGSRRRRVR